MRPIIILVYLTSILACFTLGVKGSLNNIDIDQNNLIEVTQNNYHEVIEYVRERNGTLVLHAYKDR